MIKIYKYLGFIIAIIINTSCAGKHEPDEISIGINITNRAVDYSLKGDETMAEYTYIRAVNHFRNMGKFCDMARVSLAMYISEPIETNSKKIDDAIAFAILGNCNLEVNIGNFLKNNNYDYSSLKEPYKSYAKFKNNHKSSTLSSIASSSSYSNKIRSAFYRIMADTEIDNNPEKALKFINKAMEIDSKHSWTKNILYNEKIILKIYKKLNKDTNITEEKIKILEKYLNDINK